MSEPDLQAHPNADPHVVMDFGGEGEKFDQSGLSPEQGPRTLRQYFDIFPRAEIQVIMEAAGLERISFSPDVPFWTAVGYKR
ncbi:MAG: hypothetical protein EXR69_14310 [Myxococcales bacterium]|nr:hypothetical protein [Myxococcales bacterium]